MMSRLIGSNARWLGNGVIAGRLYALGHYPGAVPSSEPGDVVHGEVFALRNATFVLRQLDRYEDCQPGDGQQPLFTRQCVQVGLMPRTELNAWVYFYARSVSGLRAIPDGRWRANRAVIKG